MPGKDKKRNNRAVGVTTRCSEEERNTERKLSLFILQVARALATTEEENASEKPSVASKPLQSRCVWFVVVGLTAV